MDDEFGIDEPAFARARFNIEANAIAKRLINFDTSIDTLKPGHEAYLRREVLPTLLKPNFIVHIVGHASKLKFRTGSKDNNAPAAMMAKMATHIPSASYVELEGVGHLANLERPAAFNAALDRFLRNSATGTATS